MDPEDPRGRARWSWSATEVHDTAFFQNSDPDEFALFSCILRPQRGSSLRKSPARQLRQMVEGGTVAGLAFRCSRLEVAGIEESTQSFLRHPGWWLGPPSTSLPSTVECILVALLSMRHCKYLNPWNFKLSLPAP